MPVWLDVSNAPMFPAYDKGLDNRPHMGALLESQQQEKIYIIYNPLCTHDNHTVY